MEVDDEKKSENQPDRQKPEEPDTSAGSAAGPAMDTSEDPNEPSLTPPREARSRYNYTDGEIVNGATLTR